MCDAGSFGCSQRSVAQEHVYLVKINKTNKSQLSSQTKCVEAEKWKARQKWSSCVSLWQLHSMVRGRRGRLREKEREIESQKIKKNVAEEHLCIIDNSERRVELFYLFLLSHSLFLSLSFSLKVCGLWLVFGGWMCFGELGGWQWSPSSSKCQFASCLIPSWQNVLFSRRCCWREGWGVKWASPVGELWLLSSLSNLASAVTLD